MVMSQNRALSSLHKTYKRYIKGNPYASMNPKEAQMRKLHDNCRELALRVERLNSLIEKAKGTRKAKLEAQFEKLNTDLIHLEREYKQLIGH